METAAIEPWPHQRMAARRLAAAWPLSHLLCDEVGLGKTIEAGLAIRSLRLSGFVRRVLIAAPASLTRQWQWEMANRFFLPFTLAPSGGAVHHPHPIPPPGEERSASAHGPDLTIVSTGLLARKEHARELAAAAPFDIVVLDEAQCARRRNPVQGTRIAPRYGHLYRAMEQRLGPNSRCLLLVTATPMQLDPVEVADLVRLTRRAGVFQHDPSLFIAYYRMLARLAEGRGLQEREWEFLRRAIRSLEAEDPPYWRFLREDVIEPGRWHAIRLWLEGGAVPRGPEAAIVTRLVFAAAPLSRVMMRHTRGLLEIYRERGQLASNLARRVILPIPDIHFTGQERTAYEQLEAYCAGLARRLAGRLHGRLLGYLSSFLRLRFASSLYAIQQTLARRMEKVQATLESLDSLQPDASREHGLEETLDEGEDDSHFVAALLKNRTPADLEWERDRLAGMLENLAHFTETPSKMRVLLDALEGRRVPGSSRIRQSVIFTRFYDTLTDIAARLTAADPHIRLGTYSGRGGQYFDPRTGQFVAVERDSVKQRFLRLEIDVLVCTDVAAEGLNLQTADYVVNFDLPWNPMKVEQRIGRVDRIGQAHDTVYVLNLCYPDSAERIVYDRLLRRLAEAGVVVGAQQLSLLPVTREEFQLLAERRLAPEALEAIALERARRIRQRTASMEIPPRDLYDIYTRQSREFGRARPPVDLEAIWEALVSSDYLRRLGCRLHPDEGRRMMVLGAVPGLPPGTIITGSRETYERGLPGEQTPLRLATYGDPAFDAILEHMAGFELPPCIRRLEASVPGTGAVLVGYAVAVRRRGGGSGARLVLSLSDLNDAEIDERAQLSETDLAPLTERLAQLARQEARTMTAFRRIQEANERAGRSQLALDYLLIRGLIQERRHLRMAEPLFWREIAAIEEAYRDREVLRVRHIPATDAARLSGVLYPPIVSPSGEEAYVDAPRILLEAAVDAACRLASTMKVARAALTTDEFIARATREIERLLKRGEGKRETKPEDPPAPA